MSYSWERPKLNIPKTRIEWMWDFLGYSFFLGSIIFLIVVWGNLPDQVPGHFNGAGDVTRWGSKWELIILPGIGLFILILMQVFEKFPEAHNYPKRLNETNARQFYLISRKRVNQLKNMTLVIFCLPPI